MRSAIPVMTQKLTYFLIFILLFSCQNMSAQKSHYGAFYSYGAYFNFHSSNKNQLRPHDGSAAGIYYQLDNDNKALGFRAALSWRWNDVMWKMNEIGFVLNKSNAVELKLQCTLKLSPKNNIALGMAPRIVSRSGFAIGYKSSANGTTYEEIHEIPGIKGDLNELNSALCLSWYHHFSRFTSFALHLDQDMLTAYNSSVAVPVFENEDPLMVNVRLTSLTASIILNVR